MKENLKEVTAINGTEMFVDVSATACGESKFKPGKVFFDPNGEKGAILGFGPVNHGKHVFSDEERRKLELPLTVWYALEKNNGKAGYFVGLVEKGTLNLEDVGFISEQELEERKVAHEKLKANGGIEIMPGYLVDPSKDLCGPSGFTPEQIVLDPKQGKEYEVLGTSYYSNPYFGMRCVILRNVERPGEIFGTEVTEENILKKVGFILKEDAISAQKELSENEGVEVTDRRGNKFFADPSKVEEFEYSKGEVFEFDGKKYLVSGVSPLCRGLVGKEVIWAKEAENLQVAMPFPKKESLKRMEENLARQKRVAMISLGGVGIMIVPGNMPE